MIKILSYLAIVLFVFGCADTDSVDNPAPVIPFDDQASVTKFTGNNNIGDVSGDSIGTGENTNTELAKTIPVILSSPNRNFLLGPARVARSTTDIGFTVKLILPVKNNTENRGYCSVRTSGIFFKDASEEKIITTVLDTEVFGSLGISNSKSGDSCLAPGETGYILQTVSALDTSLVSFFEDVSGVEIGSISVGSISVITPNVTILPKSYTYSESKLSITVKNDNVDTGYIWTGLSYVILLGEDNSPVHYLKIEKLGVLPRQLKTEEETILTSDEINYTGSSAKAIVLLGLGINAWSPAH